MSTERKRARCMEDEQDAITAKKNFASLPPQLRQLILSKTDTDTRLKIFQLNNEMREWVFKVELFGENLEQMIILNFSQAFITPRYGSQQKIDVFNQYIFKVVRRCRRLFFGDEDLHLTRVFPRLQSINHFEFSGTNYARLSEMFMDNAIQITGFGHVSAANLETVTENNREMFLQFIKNHLQRCKTVHFGRYPLEKIFDFLATQHLPQAIFRDHGDFLGGAFHFEEGLKMIIRNGIPSLHPESTIWMIIDSERAGELIQILNTIAEGTGVVMENEAIRKKFLASYEKVGGCWVNGSLAEDPFGDNELQLIDRSDFVFFGLKKKFDDERNLIFLIYVWLYNDEDDEINDQIHIHLKFDPVEE